MLSFRKKNAEIQQLVWHFNEIYEGEPWHGKGVKAIFENVPPAAVFQKPAGQHSILELVWHMQNWKAFALNRLLRSEKDLAFFEENDWLTLDHADTSLWQKGLDEYWSVHRDFMQALQQQDDRLLDQIVQGRKYNYRKLLWGLAHHDVYHSGQIAYIVKLLQHA